MIREFTETAGLQLVAPPIEGWTDEVVPGLVELLPSSNYSPVYAWMYAYEKGLKRRIERLIGQPLGVWERRLFGADGAFSEALSNAFLHGHRRDPALPITIRCTVGERGLFFAISDQGPGFDSAAVLAARARSAPSFHIAGNGLRCLAETPGLTVWWADGGRTLRLLVDLTT